MIDETDVVTYCSENAATDSRRWAAYVVLPNGSYWGIMFMGATEEAARQSAISSWNTEKAKVAKREPEEVTDRNGISHSVSADPWASVVKEHHLAGKVWMIHNETREKKRVALTEISLYENNGWARGGPRSK